MSTLAGTSTGTLQLAAAARMADETLAAARRSGCKPMTVVVLDAGGHVVVAKREDGSGIARFEIAHGKAWAALGMGIPSRRIEELGMQRPVFVASLAAVFGGRLAAAPGGVLILCDAGAVLGAVGVSGDTSDADERCAIEGIRSAGCSSLPAQAAGEE